MFDHAVIRLDKIQPKLDKRGQGIDATLWSNGESLPVWVSREDALAAANAVIRLFAEHDAKPSNVRRFTHRAAKARSAGKHD